MSQYLVKIGDSYVTASGGLSTYQSDAIRVDVPTGPVKPRLVRFRARNSSQGPQHDYSGRALNADLAPLSAAYDDNYYDDSGF